MTSLRSLLLSAVVAAAACATSASLDNPPDNPAPADDARAAARTSTVTVHYPTGWGHRIALRGSGGGLDWTRGRDAAWGEGDAWVLSVSLTAAVDMKPLFDDAVWSKGPNFRLTPGQTLDVWPVFFHDRGRLERRESVRSTMLDRDRDVVTYVPPSYDENAHERYPVVYMHDGQNLWLDGDAFGGVSWDVVGAMDRGFADASIHEALVVGVDNTADRIWEYTPTDGGYGGGGAAAYLGFIADELKPAIDSDYRTLVEREHTAIIGSSLGGLVSVWGGVTRHETFGLVGALSPSTWWDGTWILGQVRDAAVIPARTYVDSGDSGNSKDDIANTKLLAGVYESRGARLKYLVQAGASHNEIWWRQRLPGALGFLLGGR